MLQPRLSPKPNRRQILAMVTSAAALPLWAQGSSRWSDVLSRARGQTVYFNAWAGSERINAYIRWAAEQIQQQHGVKLEHVKVTETAEVVKRVRTEKAAGKTDGTVDLVWINGENFLTMKREGLLFGPFAEQLPNFQYVDVAGKPTTRVDFSEPVEGFEAPWGMAQLTFFADRKRVPTPPRDMAALLDFARANPGRVTYPQLPDFHGTSFVKQVLVERTADRAVLYRPVTQEALAAATAPLWTYLDALHPHLWRAGRQFPQNAAAIRQMMSDGELMMALTFNPNEAANEIAAKRLAGSVYSFQFSAGTIGNTHFLAIPVNARAREGAQVVANFLLSPLAQARKADIALWGDPTVLAIDKLNAADRARFSAGVLPGQLERPAPTILEPHGSWVDPLEKEWLRRYGA
ncbi:MAG: ABC transporter substrate-binding protein [Rhodoferax sp.]|mgnify:CR=1 FL=1|nr:ABC transporter substrate-binding protein [Rhodoferax sp.]HRA62494.1 ABC transporter substrate-binding protein [Burkholderiaceae bacterium]